MALANKRYARMYSTTGSDSDKVDSSKITRMESKFTSNEYLEDDALFEQQGMLIVQMQKLIDEFDEIRRHVTNDVVGQAGADGAQGAKGDTGNAGARGANGGDGARGADGAAGGVYGNIIKILPTQFMGNDDASLERTVIEDDVRDKIGVRVASSSQEIFASVTIPEGKKVTGYAVYSSSSVSTFLNGVDATSGAFTSIGSGNSGAVINLKKAYNSAQNNYVAIKVMTTSTSQVIYGAVITIANI